MNADELADTKPRRGSISEPFEAEFDVEAEPFEWVIYDTIAQALGLDAQADSIPIHDQIDPDALNALFTDTSGDAYVSFPIYDARVTIRSDGHIEVQPVE